MLVFVCASMCPSMHACMRACVCACAQSAHVFLCICLCAGVCACVYVCVVKGGGVSPPYSIAPAVRMVTSLYQQEKLSVFSTKANTKVLEHLLMYTFI